MDTLTTKYVIGVDEVGCGAIAGPLIVAAAAFPADMKQVTAEWRGVRGPTTLSATDSKRVNTADRRAVIDSAVRESATAIAVIERSANEIDARLFRTVFPEAVQLAVRRCVERLAAAIRGLQREDFVVLIDGDLVRPDVPCTVRMVPGGDASDWRIGAASIVAKTQHDKSVSMLCRRYPAWQFDKHRGYPTKKHLELLHETGPIDGVHRKTFAPVREARGNIAGME